MSKKSNLKDEQNFLNKLHTVATKRGITSTYIWYKILTMVGYTRKHKHKLWESTYLSVYLSINLSICLNTGLEDMNHIFFTEVDEMNK